MTQCFASSAVKDNKHLQYTSNIFGLGKKNKNWVIFLNYDSILWFLLCFMVMFINILMSMRLCCHLYNIVQNSQ